MMFKLLAYSCEEMLVLILLSAFLKAFLVLRDAHVVFTLSLEPLVEFYTMRIHAEGTYIMRRFAACYIAADPMNMLPIIALMGAFQHALTKVVKTVAAIRHVKVRSSANPKVPLSWLRPCYKKPKLRLIVDGE